MFPNSWGSFYNNTISVLGMQPGQTWTHSMRLRSSYNPDVGFCAKCSASGGIEPASTRLAINKHLGAGSIPIRVIYF
uniref:Laminin N-terminal domain-containing protein n=1 Tax=Steinernema glaseri TaxID=37863 RepID=A0A1I7YPI9_9BILA